MIWFRKKHRTIRIDTEPCSVNYPYISQHGLNPFWCDYNGNHHYVGIMYAGKNKHGADELVYMAINAHWVEQIIELPMPPEDHTWYVTINTYEENSVIQDIIPVRGQLLIPPRTVMVMETYRIER